MEWVALVCLVALVLASVVALADLRRPAKALAEAVAAKIACAAGLGDPCESQAEALAAAYGERLARLVGEHAPTLRYEAGMAELPVDFRDCREDACARATRDGEVWRTDMGNRAVAFTHVIDCRASSRAEEAANAPDCSGSRAGNLYLQYWLYWPDSQTDPWGERGYHADDWESFQVRIGGETVARASSHHSYNYRGGIANWPSDAGVVKKSGWGPFVGELHVSAGSHAGHVSGDPDSGRFTPASRLRLVPLEPVAATGRDDDSFAVTPPWLKDVYSDPESKRT